MKLACPHCGLHTEELKSTAFMMIYTSGNSIGFIVTCTCEKWYQIEYNYGHVTVEGGDKA